MFIVPRPAESRANLVAKANRGRLQKPEWHGGYGTVLPVVISGPDLTGKSVYGGTKKIWTSGSVWELRMASAILVLRCQSSEGRLRISGWKRLSPLGFMYIYSLIRWPNLGQTSLQRPIRNGCSNPNGTGVTLQFCRSSYLD